MKKTTYDEMKQALFALGTRADERLGKELQIAVSEYIDKHKPSAESRRHLRMFLEDIDRLNEVSERLSEEIRNGE